MSKFKVGDRVKYTNTEFPKIPYGSTGIIKEVGNSVAFVAWDGAYSYRVFIANLKLVETKPTFAVGDTVRIKRKIGASWAKIMDTTVGMTGVIIGNFSGTPGQWKVKLDRNNDTWWYEPEALEHAGTYEPSFTTNIEEPTMRLTNAIKFENVQFVTLPGSSGRTEISTLSNDTLLTAIQDSEKAIASLNELKTQPKIVQQQIVDLQNGIDAMVELLDKRFDEANKTAPATPSA